MQELAAITSVVLTILTGIYVLLTHKLVMENRRATQAAREAFERQFQISIYPTLSCRIEASAAGTRLAVFNLGSVPAMDLDIVVIGSYSHEDLDVSNFVTRFVQKECPHLQRLASSEDTFGVFERLCYELMPQKKRVHVELEFPLAAETLTILLQFRDLAGNNYTHLYWFFKDSSSTEYRLAAVDPKSIKPSARLRYDRELKMISENQGEIPKYVQEHFLELWKASIPTGYLKQPYRGPEDRGEWRDL